jgi:hypothetical protein
VTEISKIKKCFVAQERKEPPRQRKAAPALVGKLAKKEILCCRTLATMLISVRCAALDARFACASRQLDGFWLPGND